MKHCETKTEQINEKQRFSEKNCQNSVSSILSPFKTGQDRDPILHQSTVKHQRYRILVVDF